MNFKKAFKVLFESENEDKTMYNMFSNRVRALNKHIDILEKVIDDQNNLIENLSKQANANRAANMEERVIQTLLNAFMPQHKTSPSPGSNPGEGTLLSDEEITNRIKLIPAGLVPKIQQLPDDMLAGKIKELYPEMHRESISKAIKRIKAL